MIGHCYKSGELITSVFPVAECCDYGNDKAIDNVTNLLIDSGVPSLGQRKELFLTEDIYLGVAFTKHKSVYNHCIILRLR